MLLIVIVGYILALLCFILARDMSKRGGGVDNTALIFVLAVIFCILLIHSSTGLLLFYLGGFFPHA